MHSQIASVIPSLRFEIGEGALGFNLGRSFAGIFGFLLPQQWMKLKNQARIYKLTKKFIF